MIFIGLTAKTGIKAELPLQLRETFLHTCADLPPLLSVETTGVCIPTGNTGMFLAAVYTSPQRQWSDTNITELPCFGSKFILATDLIAKHPVWDSEVSNPSRLKLLVVHVFISYNFEISTPQCCTHYTPDGRGDVFGIIVHQNARLSEVTVNNVLDSAKNTNNV
jgi:hypothetical protein